jgi:hypothetical protein
MGRRRPVGGISQMARDTVDELCGVVLRETNMGELDKLKKENKQLRALLKNAVELLNQSKKLLKRSDKPKKAKKNKK